MKFVPPAISRKVASQALVARKNSPTLLFGAGVVSMVGSTVMACRATLKLEEVLTEIEHEKKKSEMAKEYVDAGKAQEGTTYTDEEIRRDLAVISVRGVGKIVRLYAPTVLLGGVGILCLTRSHQILQERNVALTAAYVAVDKAYQAYRERVVERYGADVDREMRYGSERVDIIDDETGKVVSTVRVPEGMPSGYARWFDEDNPNWQGDGLEEYNWTFLRSQQNWANDFLHSRGHFMLNEVYSMLGLPRTSAGAVVGWVYDKNNDRGDNYIDFGCWGDDDGQPLDFFNGRDGILLDFNVDGVVWDLIDKMENQA